MAEGEEEDKESKTEEPTPRRLERAIEQGQVINSREVSSFVMIATLTLIVVWVIPFVTLKIYYILRYITENSYDIDLSGTAIGDFIKYIFLKIITYFIIPLFIIFLACLISPLVQQGGINFSSEPLMPDLNRISIISGIKRLFSIKSLSEFFKGIVKISVLGLIMYFTIKSKTPALEFLTQIEIGGLIEKLYELCKSILISTTIFVGFLAVLDYFYQRYEYFSNLRMTKEELKEEYKQTEGNPEIKKKLRAMMAAKKVKSPESTIPTADVIITNPTHYSIALKYNENTMKAPIVVAKGLDFLALKIREIAKSHDIPIVENRELARILYKEAEIDAEIPFEHYEAVAKIISYVYKLKKRKKQN